MALRSIRNGCAFDLSDGATVSMPPTSHRVIGHQRESHNVAASVCCTLGTRRLRHGDCECHVLRVFFRRLLSTTNWKFVESWGKPLSHELVPKTCRTCAVDMWCGVFRFAAKNFPNLFVLLRYIMERRSTSGRTGATTVPGRATCDFV